LSIENPIENGGRDPDEGYSRHRKVSKLSLSGSVCISTDEAEGRGGGEWTFRWDTGPEAEFMNVQFR
jgi:hypothetical protein